MPLVLFFSDPAVPPLDHSPAPAARPSPPDQDNRTGTQRAREGTGKRRYPLFFVADFSPPTTTSSAGDRQDIRRAFRLCGMLAEIRQTHRNATGSRRRAVKLAGSTGTPTPKEKRHQQPLKCQREEKDHRQPLRVRARLFPARLYSVQYKTISKRGDRSNA